jgi:Asp/Glu/hydantoin racemase
MLMPAPSRIVCVHATQRAEEPARRMLAAYPQEFEQDHFVHEALLSCSPDQQRGRELFLEALRQADELRPAAILTTCSIYTPQLPFVRQNIATPIVGVDEALIEQAAQVGSPLALVGSLETAIALAAEQIERRAQELGASTSITQRRLVPLDACETPAMAQSLAAELRRLREHVQAVVVVQLSLSPVGEHLSPDEHRTILTSPPAALARLRAAIQERAR